MSNKDTDLTDLKTTISTTLSLLTHLRSSLTTQPASNPSIPSNEVAPNALALASSATSLIHAQTTKLALLVLNKPFTPTAITKILKSLASESIPALATSTQLSAPPAYPRCVHEEIALQARTILREFEILLAEIPVDERGVEDGRSKGALGNTGVIWGACEAVKGVGEGGCAEVAAKRVGEWRELVGDALEELREWRESGEEDQDDDEDDDGEEDDDGGSMDMVMDSKCPAKMLAVAGWAIGVVEHVRLLYPPLIKRRIKRFPALSAATKVEELPDKATMGRLDQLMTGLETLHDEVDQAAFVLYERGYDDVVAHIRKLSSLAESTAKSMMANWSGTEDELTSWINDKYLVKLHELSRDVPTPG